MKSMDAALTLQGQVALPASLRKALGLKTGDDLVFKQDAHGRNLAGARTETSADLRGSVGSRACDPTGPVDCVRIARWIAESRGARRSGMGDTGQDGET